MAYNEELDRRIKKMVSRWQGTTDKKMFGGVCHLINGNMFCGVHKDFLIL
jgi:TfoX/Sxy family transcriptional regulator of competence genes